MTDEKNDDLKRVGDIFPGMEEVDKFVDIAEILDEELIITDIQERSGKFGDYVTIIAHEKGSSEKIGFNCGGTVVRKKLIEIKNKQLFPIAGKFLKPEGKKYFDVV